MIAGLTDTEIKLLIAAASMLGGLVGWAARGASFLVKRRVTGAAKQEQVTYLNSVADLGSKLRSSGMTVEEVSSIEALLKSPALTANSAAAEMLVGTNESLPQAMTSTAALRARAHLSLEVAEAQLRQAEMNFRLLATEEELPFFEEGQVHWRAYRHSLAETAGAEYTGGTLAPLAGLLAEIAETERRTAELRAASEERSQR